MQNRIQIDQHAAVSSSGEETQTTVTVTVDGQTTTVATVGVRWRDVDHDPEVTIRSSPTDQPLG